MDGATIDRIKAEFPGKNVFVPEGDDPKEVVVEISNDGEKSVAIAFIDEGAPHFHRVLTETYEVLEGKLTLHVGAGQVCLEPGGSWTVRPGERHYALGRATRVRVTCTPPWTPDDHVLCD